MFQHFRTEIRDTLGQCITRQTHMPMPKNRRLELHWSSLLSSVGTPFTGTLLFDRNMLDMNLPLLSTHNTNTKRCNWITHQSTYSLWHFLWVVKIGFSVVHYITCNDNVVFFH